jgi:hypothetical protein
MFHSFELLHLSILSKYNGFCAKFPVIANTRDFMVLFYSKKRVGICIEREFYKTQGWIMGFEYGVDLRCFKAIFK